VLETCGAAPAAVVVGVAGTVSTMRMAHDGLVTAAESGASATWARLTAAGGFTACVGAATDSAARTRLISVLTSLPSPL
jgi:hypothetical protein